MSDVKDKEPEIKKSKRGTPKRGQSHGGDLTAEEIAASQASPVKLGSRSPGSTRKASSSRNLEVSSRESAPRKESSPRVRKQTSTDDVLANTTYVKPSRRQIQSMYLGALSEEPGAASPQQSPKPSADEIGGKKRSNPKILRTSAPQSPVSAPAASVTVSSESPNPTNRQQMGSGNRSTSNGASSTPTKVKSHVKANSSGSSDGTFQRVPPPIELHKLDHSMDLMVRIGNAEGSGLPPAPSLTNIRNERSPDRTHNRSRSLDQNQARTINSSNSRRISDADTGFISGPGQHPGHMTYRVMMEGQLFKRNEAHRWKKRWVNLSNTHISIFKGKDKESKTPKMVKLQHSSVREFADDSRKGFELLAQDGKHYVFSAEHETENGTWITAIRTVLDDLMNMALTDNADHDAWHGGKNQRQKTLRPELLSLLIHYPENSFCADCRQDDPDWASLTFGTFVCIDCSGVHRSLGRNISTIRSIQFDHWDDDQIKLLSDHGNKEANAFWEKSVPDSVVPPNAASSMDAKREWIINKYIRHEFTGGATEAEIDKQVFGAPGWCASASLFAIHQSTDLDYGRHGHGLRRTRSAEQLFKKQEKEKTKELKRLGKEEKKRKKLQGTDPQLREMEYANGVLQKYMTNQNLLKEAILYLLDEDEHFRRHVRHVLIKEDE